MPANPESEDLRRFGENIRQARAARGISQMDLSREMTLHVTSIARLEAGHRNPSLATILKLARALRVEPGKLLQGF